MISQNRSLLVRKGFAALGNFEFYSTVRFTEKKNNRLGMQITLSDFHGHRIWQLCQTSSQIDIHPIRTVNSDGRQRRNGTCGDDSRSTRVAG
jgi:hypothetical protein